MVRVWITWHCIDWQLLDTLGSYAAEPYGDIGRRAEEGRLELHPEHSLPGRGQEGHSRGASLLVSTFS